MDLEEDYTRVKSKVKHRLSTAKESDSSEYSESETDSEFVQAPGEAGRSLNYESREGDALLARIKSLALLR